MITDYFLRRAHAELEESFSAYERREYSFSWIKTIPSRANFLVDAVIHVVSIPFLALGMCYSFWKIIYTWGDESDPFLGSCAALDQCVSRVTWGIVGGLLSPAAAYFLKEVPGSFILGITALGVAASAIPFPNILFYNSTNGFTWGWYSAVASVL